MTSFSTHPTAAGSEAQLELLLKHDGSAPRYTSYPPANFFVPVAPGDACEDLVGSSNFADPRNLSLYVHIPFCPRRCLFCGCHTEIGQPGRLIRRYMDALPREFALLAPRLDNSRPVTQIHFGGGTPNAAPADGLSALLSAFADEFDVSPEAEIAIECDPGLMLEPQLEALRKAGFNRVSFGIQDVNPQVLEAVNRRPSRLPLPELVQCARALGFFGINLDLIYGLPFQTPASFRETVAAILAARPDRVSLFPYAHVPWIKGHQSRLDALPMPDAATRVRIGLQARDAFLEAGYEAVGMDHFALPDDELAQAKRSGGLHRNFQGYCVRARAGQVHALGASGISQLQAGYLQNEKDIPRYVDRVEAGELPFAAAYRMRPQDMAVRALINGLLAQGRSDFDALSAPGLDPDWVAGYKARSLEKLAPFVDDGLAVLEPDGVAVTPGGFPLLRRIAAAFDPMVAAGPRFSRAL